MSLHIDGIVSKMTLEEKAALCSGLDSWHTKPIERLGIPSIMTTDGHHGLRKQSEESDNSGTNQSVPATCFPSGAGLAGSWDAASHIRGVQSKGVGTSLKHFAANFWR